MKAFNRIFAAIIAVIILLFAAANIMLAANASEGRPYRVEINRLANQIETHGYADVSDCEYVTNIEKYGENFFNAESDYAVREISSELYRFDYKSDSSRSKELTLTLNIILGAMTVLIISVMLYIKFAILTPFEKLKEVPYELSKGNLTLPVKETKNRFFGRFIWGVDMLREKIQQQKQREFNLQKDKKTLLLSLSHDIKTPLSAIKLYSKALSKGLYESPEKQLEIAESINAKADEIENYVSQIVTASKEDFLTFDVNIGEFYLSALITKIKEYYKEKLSLIGTDFSVSDYPDCLLIGDLDRSVEVLQNVMENAIKYGDGNSIAIIVSQEEGSILVTVKNSGSTLTELDLPHIFESFWRGANAEKITGSGLGLYISRKLMRKMNGEIFAEIQDEYMQVTAVFTKV